MQIANTTTKLEQAGSGSNKPTAKTSKVDAKNESSAQEFLDTFEKMALNSARSNILGAIATLNRPLTKVELRAVTMEHCDDAMHELAVDSLADEKLIILDRKTGTVKPPTTNAGKEFIENIANNAGFSMMRQRVQVILGS